MLLSARCRRGRIEAEEQDTTGVQAYSDKVRKSCMR